MILPQSPAELLVLAGKCGRDVEEKKEKDRERESEKVEDIEKFWGA